MSLDDANIGVTIAIAKENIEDCRTTQKIEPVSIVNRRVHRDTPAAITARRITNRTVACRH